MTVRQGILPFKIEETPRQDVTSYAGLPLVIESLRAITSKADYKTLARALGYRGWRTVRRHLESLLCLIVAGGSCLDDLHRLRADEALSRLIQFRISSPSQAKTFLYRFHQAEDGRPLTRQDDAALSAAGTARIRPEGPGLRALARLLGRVIARGHPQRIARRATLDVDATLVEAAKAAALRTYEGFRGYQPQMAWWAERQMWVCDQFRDGNVPAEFEIRAFLEAAFGALPAGIAERRLRGDSALYNEDALTWADAHGIEFAVSADMSASLARAIAALPQDAWRPYPSSDDSDREERWWAEVSFVPGWARNHKKNGEPFRYIAIRVRTKQSDLFADDGRYFAVVTNMDWDGGRLLHWHREKQGTVERGHAILKNDLAGGVLPCGRFGANAAWWRLNALAHDLLQLIKLAALPPAMADMRPKALRFHLFNVAGHIARHARRIVLTLATRVEAIAVYAKARAAILALATASG
jgi:hypothetical protein